MLIFQNYDEKKLYRLFNVFLCMVFLTLTDLAFGETCEGDKLVIPEAEAQSLPSIQSSAIKGDSHAQAQLGMIYLQGKVVKQDEFEGFSWLEKSAAGGSSEGQYLLGEYYVKIKKYDDATLKEEGLHRASVLFKQSADQGCIPSLFVLSLQTIGGKGVPKNQEEGTRMLTKAAEAGYTRAQTLLAVMLINGQVMNKDTQAGFNWARRAAGTGDSDAGLLLAALYLEGTGTQKNPERALSLLESIYSNHDEQASTAAYNLGKTYMDGNVVPVDTVKALNWMIIAANSNIYDSAQRLKTLTEQLPKQKLAAACSVYMDPLFVTNGAKEYMHVNRGETVSVLSSKKLSDTVYFPDRRFIGYILRQCLN